MNRARIALPGALAPPFCLAVACLLTGAVLRAVQRQDTQPPARFAIELSPPEGLEGMPPSYHVIQERGSSSYFFPPFAGRLPGADSGTKAESEPSALQLEYRVTGDLVEVFPTLFFGEFDRNKTPESLAGLKKQLLAVRSGRLNDFIEIGELERFGFRPLTVKVVSARPESPSRMHVMSRAPSIELRIVSEDRAGFMVAYHNTSSRACMGFAVTTEPQPEGNESLGGTASWSKGVIAPGATLQQPFGVARSGRKTPAGFVPDAPSSTIVLLAALFEDGSFEGDPSVAARLEAGRDAGRLQRQRVNQVVNSILDDPSLDDPARVARIRLEIARLSEEPDAGVIDAVRARFPDLSPRAVSRLPHAARPPMQFEKQRVLSMLDDFERLLASHVPLSLAQRWKAEETAGSSPK